MNSSMHLDPEKIQAFLDGQLSSGEMAGFQAHTAACARCRAEVEGWEFLFEELDELPLVEPTVGFMDEVMAALPAVAPAKNPVRRWLGGRTRAIRHTRSVWVLPGSIRLGDR